MRARYLSHQNRNNVQINGTNMCEETTYRMLSLPGASLTISQGDQGLSTQSPGHELPVIHISGNRRGMASLGSILLWLHGNNAGQEFLALSALPFIKPEGIMALSIRATDEGGTGLLGRLRLLDKQCQFEWAIPEDDLPDLAVRFYRLASSKTPLHDNLPQPRFESPGPRGRMNSEIPLEGDAEVFAGCTGEWQGQASP